MAKDRRFSLRLPDNIKAKIEEERTRRRGRVSENAVIVAALKAYFDPDEADKKDIALLRRLDMIERQLRLLKTQNEAIAESFGVYARSYFAEAIALRKSNAITPADLEVARMQADAVYKAFIERVGANLNLGGEFFKNIPDQVFDPSQFTTREIEDGTIVDTEDEGNPDE